MARAVWNDETLAESGEYEFVEGNVYFPSASVKGEYLKEGDRQYTCPWKGKARYYDVVVKGQVNKNAAWSYPETTEAAEYFKGYIAFGGGIEVER